MRGGGYGEGSAVKHAGGAIVRKIPSGDFQNVTVGRFCRPTVLAEFGPPPLVVETKESSFQGGLCTRSTVELSKTFVVAVSTR